MVNGQTEMEDMARLLRMEGLNSEEMYQYLLLEFNGVPYIHGGETLDGSDCSGSVCCVLSHVFQKKIRVTADELYKRYFTKQPRGYSGIQAMFFLDASGKAVHVAGGTGSGEYMNVSNFEANHCGALRDEYDLKQMYKHLTPELRTFNTEAL